ncbi:MAG: DUF4358 domain-containing protein [Clostridia bacterium]|nr:DUF4358 domain-containing protein [Clostridia bacterium]
MKKALALLLVLGCVFCAACAGSEKKLACTMDGLFDMICQVNAEGDMFPRSADRLEELGIPADSFKSGKFMIPEESAGVETIAFFEAVDGDRANVIKAALEAYVNATRVEQKDYNAENYQVALDAEVVKEGNYVYLVMSSAKEAILKIINDNLK